MKDNRKKQIDEIMETIQQLPKEKQKAIYLIIQNIEFFEEICKNSEMTMEEIDEYKVVAIEKGDYVMLVLICMTQVYKEKDNETK